MPIDHTGSMNLKRKRVSPSTVKVAAPMDVEAVPVSKTAPHMVLRARRGTCPIVSESIPRKQRTRACARTRTASLRRPSECSSGAELEGAEALSALQAGPPSSIEGLIAADILMAMRAGPLVVIDGLRSRRAAREIGCEESSSELPVGKVSQAGRVHRPSLKVIEMAAASNYAKFIARSKHS